MKQKIVSGKNIRFRVVEQNKELCQLPMRNLVVGEFITQYKFGWNINKQHSCVTKHIFVDSKLECSSNSLFPRRFLLCNGFLIKSSQFF